MDWLKPQNSDTDLRMWIFGSVDEISPIVILGAIFKIQIWIQVRFLTTLRVQGLFFCSDFGIISICSI